MQHYNLKIKKKSDDIFVPWYYFDRLHVIIVTIMHDSCKLINSNRNDEQTGLLLKLP